MTPAEDALEPLAGDASTRRFFRKRGRGGSRIIMDYGGPFGEEGSRFLLMREYLASLGVPVPRVYAVERERGRIELEDLGELLLEDLIAEEEEARWLESYREATDLIVKLQSEAKRRLAEEDFPFDEKLDAARFRFEMEFFRRHFLGDYLGWAGREGEGADLAVLLDDLAGQAAAAPVALCHRDYHARNILVGDRGIGLVDFQDAKPGPRFYDLASLLFDSYVDLPEVRIRELFLRFLRKSGLEPTDEIETEFLTVAVQRNVKALGTFGYMIAVRGKDRYRDAIPRTVRHLRRNLPLLPEQAPLAQVLLPLLEFRGHEFRGHHT